MSGQENSTQRTIKLLIQIQELHIARAQKKATQPNSRLKKLNDTVDSLIAEIPDAYSAKFVNLLNRDPLAIAPITGTACSACAMALPIGTVNEIRANHELVSCEACARFLYYPEDQPKGVPPKKTSTPKTGISRFSCTDLMIPRMTAKTSEDVLVEIANTLSKHGFVDDGEKLAEEAIKREILMSTAVENAIAFPHVRGIEGGGLTLALGTHKKGIQFGGPGGKLTRIFFFMTIPTVTSGFYLKLVAGLCQTFDCRENCDALLQAETPEELWNALNKATKKLIR